ncbi:hypothetical protein SAMN05216474_2419 [Lishizhenia tianjinensis]|uniref:Lipoprotein n=1 Tax=Lishizhenia tianjinensis TaxID=477690 RepID=A0A1I7AZJ9_9FLAO|nr:hypothetical protein [Lishizhenia tianjinensis]SFT80333.1 hypothetical protein SAMN05216474_2419 [Lishizhenia tianjinensis]
MKNHFKLLALAGLLASCISIELKGITTDYQYLDQEQKARVKKLSTFEAAAPGYVYEITGEELRQELKTKDSSVFGFIVNYCSGGGCLPMSTYQSYAEESGKAMYLMMHTYSNFDYTMDQEPAFPLFAVNAYHYQEVKKRKFRKLFLQDLLKDQYHDSLYHYDTFLFNNDSLVKVQNYIIED